MNGHQRQREQSRQMIENALFTLLEKKSLAQITISEIVKKADVARRTFYRLYGGKEEVLKQYFHELCEEYKRQCPALDCYEIGQIAGEYFGFWYGYRERLLLLQRCGLGEYFYCELGRLAADAVKSRISRRELRTAPEVDYFAVYSAGGFLQLLRHWVEQGMPGTPEGYAQEVSRALLRFIRPAEGRGGTILQTGGEV